MGFKGAVDYSGRMCDWSVNDYVQRYVAFTMLEQESRGADDEFKHLSLNKWELLAAGQALTMYISIRIDEGETDYNNFDALLVATVIVCLAPTVPLILALMT